MPTLDAWWARAGCRNTDPDIFLPLKMRAGYRHPGAAGTPSDEVTYAEAAPVCRSCPVRVECLNDALQSDFELVAYQGGFSPGRLQELRWAARRSA